VANCRQFFIQTLTMNVSNLPKERFSSAMAIFLLFLFVYTAVSKILNPGNFRLVLLQQAYLQPYAELLTIAVPLFEFAVALLLVYLPLRKAGLFISAILMAVFTLYVGMMLLFSSSLPCSCGGVIEKMSWKAHLVFNAVVTVLSWTAYRFQPKESKILLQ
jgi:hypothetical protein